MTEPVGIGTAIVAFIEPHEGQARAFNRWYEGDHFYAAVTGGPGCFAGARWVATGECKALRPGGTLLGDPRRASYLTTAWVLEGMQADWDAWVLKQMETITAQHRLFPGRDHVHTAIYRFHHARGPVTYALDRGYTGVYAVATEAGAREVEAWTTSLTGAGVPVVVALTPERVVLTQAEPGDHVLIFVFAAGDVFTTWRDCVEPALKELSSVGFASPFLRTVPGTDTYTEEL